MLLLFYVTARTLIFLQLKTESLELELHATVTLLLSFKSQFIGDPSESVCKLSHDSEEAVSLILPLVSVQLTVEVLGFEVGR